MENYKKLVASFNNDMIAKIIMILYTKDDVAKVFEGYKTTKDVFDGVSKKYNIKTTTHIYNNISLVR